MKRILVFPCGSEIGLEIHRSLCYSIHFELIGASSVDDHGRFIYEEYVPNVPFITDARFEDYIIKVVNEKGIDAIYPAMDSVAEILQNIGIKHGIKVIGSSPEATAICASKSSTYSLLQDIVPTPVIYNLIGSRMTFPVFVKPDRGYGSRNSQIVRDEVGLQNVLDRSNSEKYLVLEYLPGPEWTIDCFTDRHGRLLFQGARRRSRISNGISVHTLPDDNFMIRYSEYAEKINMVLKPRGAWFFQMKLDENGSPKLLEVAARLGGSSALFRARGVNFALLSAFDAFGFDVDIHENSYDIEMDRALDNRFKINLTYHTVYVDLDDCLIIKGKVNTKLLSFLYDCLFDGKSIQLITRHKTEPLDTLHRYRIGDIFEKIHHITNGQSKAEFINSRDSIFIDDSNAERMDVANRIGISVFAPDMIDVLI